MSRKSRYRGKIKAFTETDNNEVMPLNSGALTVADSAQLQIGAVREFLREDGFRARDAASFDEGDILAILANEDFRERFIYNDAEICGVIIRRYLMKLKGNRSVATLSGAIGASAVVPVKRPRTLEEAKALAERFISK